MGEFLDVYYVVTYIPADAADEFLQKVTTQIPKLCGEYDRCAWWSAKGTEQFRPLEGARPERGVIGAVEQYPSVRLEFCLPMDQIALSRMVETVIRPAHPYEEPVIIVQRAQISRPHF